MNPEASPPAVAPAEGAGGPGLEGQGQASLARATRKMLGLVAGAALVLVVLRFTPLKAYLGDVQSLKADLRATGAWAPFWFVLGTSVLVTCGVPRLAFSAVGGVVFGFAQGLGLSLLGSLLGSYGTFVFARWFGRDWVARRFPPDGRLRSVLDHPTLGGVFWLRQLPVAGVVTNLLLGLTAVRHRVFLAGSALGFLPTAVMMSLVGSGFGKESSWLSFVQIAFALLAGAVLLLGVWRVRRRLA